MVPDSSAANRPSESSNEVIVAPSYVEEAVDILATKNNLRILVAPQWTPATVEFRQVSGGTLVQTADRIDAEGDDPSHWRLTAGEAVPEDVLAYMDRVRAVSPIPVCAGFGIRGREQVERMTGHVDGVVVGSALVEVLERGEDPAAFLRSLTRAPATT